MVAVFSGSGLGMFGSSVSALGGIGGSGNAAPGRGNDRVFVNTATGNLIVQSQDEHLTALGLDLNLVRTYNSQGLLDDDNGDNWRLGVQQRWYNLTGVVNTAGSRITKVFGDGREVTYDFDQARGAYVSTDGDGAHDTMTNSSGTWTWTDGSGRNTETYNSSGQLTHSRDADNNTIAYGYTGSLLTQITDASGQVTYLDYTGNNLTKIRVVSDGQTQTLTRYYYDSSDRLRQVVLDLTPSDNAVSLVDANSDGLYEAVNGQMYVTTYTYDGASDRIASITQGDGSSVSFTYQQLNGQYRVHTYTDAENRTTTLTYSQPTGGFGGTNAAADPDELSTTRTENHSLNTGALTSLPGAGTWSSAQLLETANGANASSPSVVFDSTGNGYATWVFNGDIYVRRYNAATAQWTAAVRVDSNTVLSGAPQLSVDRTTGKAMLAWMQSTGVAISNYDAVTDTWGAVQLVVATGASTISKDFFSVSMAGDYVAIAYLASDGQRQNLRALIGNNGVWTTATLLENSTQSASLPQLGIDASGNALVTWRQSDGTAERVYYSRWTQANQSFSTAAVLDSGSSATERPRLSFDAQGNAFAVWGESSGLKVRRFDATSGTWSSVTSIQSATISTWDLSVDAQGNALVGWVQLDSSINSAYARRFDAAGGTWGTVTQLESSAAQVSTAKITVAIAGQNAVVGWLQSNGTADDLYAAYLSGGTWSAPQILDSRSNPAQAQFAAVDMGGNAALVWEQIDSTNARSIWQTRFTSPAGYTIPAGATWQSIANTLYGVNTAAAASALQAAMGNPTLTTGAQLSGWPLTLSYTSTVPAYYTVQAGDTWASITQAIYGTSATAAVTELQTTLGNPTLATGLELTVPGVLTYGGSGSAGYLQTDVQDALGLVTRYTQDASGQLTSVLSPTVDGARIETRYAYDDDGNVTSITQDPTGLNRITTFVYDDNGNVTLTRDSLGNTVTRTYNSNNLLLTETQYLVRDPDGAGSGQPSQPKTTNYIYDAENHLRFVITPEGNVTEHRYDTAGQLISSRTYTNAHYTSATVTEGALATWTSSTDRSYLLLAMYAYDFRGNVSNMTRYWGTTSAGGPLGTPMITRYVYDQRGQLLQTIDPRGEATTGNANDYRTAQTYDGLGRVLTTTEWISATTTRTTVNAYDDAGRITRTTLANGLVTTRTYNRVGELISVANGTASTPASMGTTSYAYDADGRLRMQTDPSGVRQFFYYDDAGRQIARVDSDGSYVEFVYNRAGQAIKTIEYAALLLPTTLATLVDGSGNPANVSLATLRSIAGGNAANDRITRNVYDASGALVYTIDPSGAVVENVYDGAGNLTDVIQYANRITIARATGEVLPSAITVTADPANDRRTRYFYDGDGQKIGQLDAEGYLTEYGYNGAGDVVDETRYANQSAAGVRVTGTFAALKTSVGTDDETSTDPERDQVTHYYYDALGRQTGALDAEGYFTEFSYDADGNLFKSIRYDQALTYRAKVDLLRNAVPGTALRETTEYTYNGEGKVLTQVVTRGTSTTSSSVTTTFSYDVMGNLVSTTRGSGTNDARTTSARYDFLGRVTQELTAVGAAALAAISNPTQPQIDDIWTRYGITYAYDLSGRKISATMRPDDTQTNKTLYFYDADNRLRFEVNALGERKEYRYNALNQLTDEVTYFNRISTSGLTGGLLNTAQLTTLTGNVSNTNDGHTLYEYSLTGRVASKSVARAASAAGGYTTFLYNAFGEQIASIDQIDATRTLRVDSTYDRRGQLTLTRWDNVAGGANISESRTYDSFGRLRTVTDGRSNVVARYEYDRLGREIASVDSDTTDRTITTYDAFARVLSVRDALNNTTTYSYDDVNRRMTVRTPEGIEVLTVFNVHSQTIYVYDGVRLFNYTYNRDGQLTNASDAQGALESRTYDRAGRQLTSTDGRNIVTRFEYDAANRVLKRIEDNAGLQLTTTYTYDGMGRVTRVDAPGGRRTDTVYNRDGSIASTAVDPTGANVLTQYGYDRQGRAITVTEGWGNNQRVTEYRYDVLGRRIEEIVDPGLDVNPTSGRPYLNLTTQYKYDANGNLTRKIDAENHSTWYVYDGDNRLTYTIDALGGVTYTHYDHEDRVVETRRYATALSGTTMSTLAGLNVVTTANFSITESASERRTQSVYDRDGRERFTIDSMGGVIERTFDDNGNVTRERAYATSIPLATYSSINQVTAAIGSTAVDIIQPNDRVQWTAYGPRGQVTYTIDGMGGVVSYFYDANNNVTSKVAYATRIDTTHSMVSEELEGWAGQTAIRNDADNRTTRYWYDATNRLRFTLDAEGYLTELRYNDAGREEQQIVYVNKPTIPTNANTANLTNRTGGVVITSSALPDQTTTTTYDAAGRVSRVTDDLGNYEEYTYDGNGNKQTYRNKLGKVWTYEYDANGRLLAERTPQVSVTTIDDSSGALTPSTNDFVIVTRMTYDDLGNVTSRREGILRNAVGGESYANSRETTYEYDALGRQTATIFPAVGVYNASGADIQTKVRSEISYDALGNAYRRRDLAIKVSDSSSTVIQDTYKLYDALGRLKRDIDALGYVTSYEYDTFGNQTSLTRHASQMTGAVPTSGFASISIASNAADRTITKTYDRLNQLKTVTQPATYVYDTASGGSYGGTAATAGATTEYQYSTFGEVVLEKRLLIGTTYADTYSYYDRLGRKTAQIDAERYLTSYEYDETGDLTKQTEYANPIATSFDVNGYTPPTSSSSDRSTVYVYDSLNRLTEERRSNTDSYFSGSTLNTVNRDVVTNYAYDALGNRTKVSVGGAETVSYYDVLGRVRAVMEAQRDRGDGLLIRPLTVTSYDAFGNAVRTVQYAKDATNVTDTSFDVTTTATLDRTTLMAYDSHNHVTHARDAAGGDRYASYTARGDVAKEWQPVTNNDNVVETLVTLYEYDALGRRTVVREPQSSTVTVKRESAYNAFGEVIATEINDLAHEYFNYDNAGRVWRTNSGDGVDRIYLYNLAGQATVEIRSQTSDLSSSNIELTNLAADLLEVDQMRTETVYDKLGRVVTKRDVEYDAASLVDQSSATFHLGNPFGANQVFLHFDNDRPGDTIKLQYRTAGSNDAFVDGPAVIQLSGAIWGADVSAFRGTKEFRVMFTAPGASTHHLIHTGTFTVGADSNSNLLELHPKTTALANNLSITATGLLVTATWSAKPSVSQARFEMSLDGVTWYSANATLAGGTWSATLGNIQDDADGTTQDWKYRVVEDVDGTPVTMSVGTLEKDGASLVTNTTINSTGQPFDSIDPASISVGSPTQLANVQVNWNPFGGNLSSCDFAWRPLQPANAPWQVITRIVDSFSLPNLPPGDYQMQVSRWEWIYEFENTYESVTATTAGTFTVNSNGSVTLNIPPSENSLSVTVASTPQAATANVTITWPGPISYNGYDIVGWKLVGTPGSGSQFPNRGSVGGSGTLSLPLQYGQTYEIQVERWQTIYNLPPEEVYQSGYNFTFTVGGTNPSPQYTSVTIPYIGPVTVDSADHSVIRVPRPSKPGSRIDVTLTGVNGTSGSFTRNFAAPAGDGSWTLDLDNPPAGEAVVPPGNYAFSVRYFDANNAFYANNGGFLDLTQSMSGPGKIQIRSVTSPEQIDTLRQIDDPISGGGRALLYWDTPSGTSGDQIKFQVLWDDPTDGITGRVWRTLPLITVGSGRAVDLSALPVSDFSYELTYTRPSEGSPHRIASGIVSVYQPTVTGTNLTDTTSSSVELDPANVRPVFEQTLDRWGNVLSYTVAAQTEAEQTTHYTYNQRNQVTQITLPTTSVRSTLNGIVSAPVEDQAIIARNYYDLKGNLIATVDPNGNRNRVSYNLASQVLSEQQAESTSITGTASAAKHYVYNAFGEQIQITDELGYLTRMSYDAGGRLRRVSREVTAGAFFAADDAADGATNGTVANPRGVLETFNYAFDPAHIVTVAYDYDEAGRRIRETTGEQMTGGGAETIKYWYDLRGNLIRSRLPVGQAYETTYSYDAYGNGKKILEIDAIGGNQNWAYDSFGKLLSYTDIHGEFGGQATGSTVTYQYNGAGLLTRQTSTYGQDITYGYDHAGHLTSIVEDSNATVGAPTEGLANVHRRSYFSYDAAGRRTREQVFVDDHEYQDTIASYDAQGRISHLQDDRYNTTYEYDKAGNRTHIYTQYTETDQVNGSWQRVDDLWYTYDGANRVTISQGRLANGMVTDQNPSTVYPDARDQAVRNTYNAAGQRIESEQFGPNSVVNETTGAATAPELGRYVSRYEYDGLGRLTEQSRMTGGEYQGQPYNELWDRRTYDGASRLKTQNIRTIENSTITTRDSVMVYDDNGRLASQASQVLDRSTGIYEPVSSTLTYGQATYSNGTWTRGFDAAGNLRSYSVATTDPDTDEVETVQHLYSYRSGSSYAEVTHSQVDGDGHVIPAVSHRGYNLNGELVGFTDHFGPEKNRYFVNNADGQAIKVLQGDFTSLTPQQLQETFEGVDHADLPQHQLIFDGKLIGSLQSDGDRFLANFDVNYTPVSEQYPSATPAQVVVQTGDTLRILAARIWGDGNLWYVIADANGLQDGPDGLLTAGQLLQIPNEVVSLANTSNTFKPFNINQVLGDTTPTQAPPPPPQNGGGCGLVGQVLVAVVAIVVTAYLGPVIGNAVGTALGGAAATGVAYSTGYAIGYGVGAAAGNAVGQGVGIAIGQQDGFSWKQVGAAALTAGILKGTPVGEAGMYASSNEVFQTAFQGVVNGTVTQGVNVAMGLQDSFDWREVALSAVSSIAAAQVGQWTAGQLAGTRMSAPLATAVTSAASGVASALVRRSLGGRMSTDAILADVFASAIGNAIVSGMTPRPMDTTPQPIGITAEQWSDVDRQLSAANQSAFDDQLQRDVRQQQFQVSLQRDLERSLSNNPEFVANLPAPRVEFEDDIFGGANPFAGARLTPTFGDAVNEYDSRVLHAIDIDGGLAPGEEWNSLLNAARQSGRSMDQVAADRKRAAALAAAASPSARERAGFYDVEKELQRTLAALPEPPKYPFDTRGVAMSAWDPAQTRREQLGWSAIGAVESNVFSAAGYIVGNFVTDPDQAAVVALRSGVAGDALLALGSARLAKVDFRSMSLPAEQAMAWQGQGLYPGVDRYRNITLQPGTYVVGASPGQGNYYTTMSGLVRTGTDVIKYYQGVQVAPNLTNPARDVVRDGLMIYRVEDLTPAAFGITSANPQYGQGRLPQIFISDYSRLTPVQLVPFQNKTPGVRPVEIMR